jgi:hypothetical protein
MTWARLYEPINRLHRPASPPPDPPDPEPSRVHQLGRLDYADLIAAWQNAVTGPPGTHDTVIAAAVAHGISNEKIICRIVEAERAS